MDYNAVLAHVLELLQQEQRIAYRILKRRRSYWIPGASAPTVFEKRSAFLRPLKKKGFKEERVAKVEGDDLDTSTTLESNKSLAI